MSKIISNTRFRTALRCTAIALSFLLVAGCGINLTGDKKSDGATSPSPTEETVINGHA